MSNKKAPGMGIGERFNPPNSYPVTPPPGTYNTPSEFKSSPDRGYTFGASHEVYKKVLLKTKPFI